MTAEQVIEKLEQGLVVTNLTSDDVLNKINAFYKAKYRQWDIHCTIHDNYTTFVRKGEFILHDNKKSFIDRLMTEHEDFMRKLFEKVWEEGHKQYER